jgi:hypothetical protein
MWSEEWSGGRRESLRTSGRRAQPSSRDGANTSRTSCPRESDKRPRRRARTKDGHDTPSSGCELQFPRPSGPLALTSDPHDTMDRHCAALAHEMRRTTARCAGERIVRIQRSPSSARRAPSCPPPNASTVNWTNGQRICLTRSRETMFITVRDATIAGLESIKEGKGYWVALYQRATREIQNSLSLYFPSVPS